ncbi:metallophosphoesterase [Phreatobacter stygius]|uniref:Metallophosphoesterase n=2 Tax=Phreatobacter stygius TaxID=1940610 RepID=A0A4D7BEF3_9HYPH|nr:metallophosphoesterase [Phreatobacter stygius]
MKPIIDPRRGDIEDDALSTKRRSLFALAGTLVAEISLPKLIAAWFILIIGPGLILGLAPQVALGWASTLQAKITAPYAGLGALLLFLVVVAIGWFGGRPLFRAAESNFWQLNSLAVQPFYVICREALRHLAEKLLPADATEAGRATLRSATSAAAGVVLCCLSLAAVLHAWPSSAWVGDIADLASPHRLAMTALANSVVLIGAYLTAAALVWSLADAAMPQPRALRDFAAAGSPAASSSASPARSWRVAHLSDLHAVGEPYGLRIESGRSGPCGNGRIKALLERLELVHAAEPLDRILVTGDTTDAGRSAEWAAFFDALKLHPRLAERMLVLPGNHDLNVVDRANPARLDLPMSPNKRLRQLRVLSAMAAIQGAGVRVVDRVKGELGATLAAALKPHLASLTQFADTGSWRQAGRLSAVWLDVFPQVLPPETEDGLGIILLNSNADTHFSFTNALGLVSAEDVKAVEIALAHYPRARWIVALHHHLVEYPMPARALSERIGTALINGSWFVRRLSSLADRIVVMHGHRHLDWIGECAGLTIVSAPSPVMEASDTCETYFYVHTLVASEGGRLQLRRPERVVVKGASSE